MPVRSAMSAKTYAIDAAAGRPSLRSATQFEPADTRRADEGGDEQQADDHGAHVQLLAHFRVGAYLKRNPT